MTNSKAPSRTNTGTRDAINVRGVIAIRWVAVLGQLVTILVVDLVLRVPLPLLPLLAIIAITASINLPLVALYRLRPPGSTAGRVKWQHVLGLTMLLDLAALTLLLYFTGGMANPFSLFFFVNLVLSAMLLPKPWAWGLTVFATCCVAGLFINFQPIPILESIANLLSRHGTLVPENSHNFELTLRQLGCFWSGHTSAPVGVQMQNSLPAPICLTNSEKPNLVF